ncbi:MAG: RNA polymerase sigma-70 factor [Rikenellaceae bacterium]|nr:RNA polymerase sigma-70 factor [Rikenellaceae bacterium]
MEITYTGMNQVATDANVLDQIRGGNIIAFNQLYRLYYAPLCVFAGRFIPDAEMRKDCVHDIFARLWDSRQQLEINISPKSYLYKAVQNQCLNIVKREKLKETYRQTILNKYDPFYETDLYSMKELEEMVQHAVARLPEKIRRTFEMSRFQHLSYKDIALRQNISVKTVESHISKALVFLAEDLKGAFPVCFLLFFMK